ncbi:hypothetical protein AX16_000533 [Volvariella volvacea WC 439]|nr:hypothetical protein AX16_000533 [Volvariella volvacea WC 439]
MLSSQSNSHRVPVPETMAIHLTDVEERICTLFDECTKHLKEEKGITTSCRIAGGWVRDKLLGSESNDLDIALSNMMGLAFAEHFAEFAATKGVETGTISKIAQNPDQSKHLETATFKIFGLELDLVNLRSEEYAENSRIPTEVTFGTPLQDALRRDITINALFYNIHTRSVEDHTEKGLYDLKQGIVRTPLPPRETFLDDPLRVLRCIRFASRFGFEIVPEIKDAAKDPVIREALVSKVARERAGEELAKMMKGRNPLMSIELIHELGLYHTIFSVLPKEISDAMSGSPADAGLSLAATSVLYALLQPLPPLPSGADDLESSQEAIPQLHPLLLTAAKNDPTCIPRLYLASALTPHIGLTYKDKKKKEIPVVEAVLRESVKLGTQNHYLDGIPVLFAARQLLREPKLEKWSTPSERVAIGLLIREKNVHNPHTGTHWSSSFLFSLVQELVAHYDVGERRLNATEARKIIQVYNDFASRVEQLGLENAGDAKPLLDGREVVAALGASKPGPWTGKALSKVIEWQLENPGGTKEACREWLQGQKDAGLLSFDQVNSEPAAKRVRTK